MDPEHAGEILILSLVRPQDPTGKALENIAKEEKNEWLDG